MMMVMRLLLDWTIPWLERMMMAFGTVLVYGMSNEVMICN